MSIVRQGVLLISIIPKSVSDEMALQDLQETKALLETYGAELTEVLIQRREIHDKGSYIGEGKIREALDIIVKKNISIVVLNAIVKPSQIYEMKKNFLKRKPNIEVWDRIDLILQIFAKHAHTAEAKLQIELAAMRHMGPRIYGMGMELSRQTGGIGTRGVGETNTELMKRHWREQMKKVKYKLNKLSIEKERQLQHRERIGLKTVSLIGYTNAGKTSLFNILTGKSKRVEDALFVTLDSAVGKGILPRSKKGILFSDTIGFIRNLPTELIDAFRSTLQETISSELLLFIIDASDPDLENKILIVEDVLYQMGLTTKKRIYVFNKIDLIEDNKRKFLSKEFTDMNPVFLSVKTGNGIDTLLSFIEIKLMEKNSNLQSRRIHY